MKRLFVAVMLLAGNAFGLSQSYVTNLTIGDARGHNYKQFEFSVGGWSDSDYTFYTDQSITGHLAYFKLSKDTLTGRLAYVSLNATDTTVNDTSVTFSISRTNLPPDSAYIADLWITDSSSNLAISIGRGKMVVSDSLFDDDDVFIFPDGVSDLTGLLSVTSAVQTYVPLTGGVAIANEIFVPFSASNLTAGSTFPRVDGSLITNITGLAGGGGVSATGERFGVYNLSSSNMVQMNATSGASQIDFFLDGVSYSYGIFGTNLGVITTTTYDDFIKKETQTVVLVETDPLSLHLNGDNAMAGDLDMGGNSITGLANNSVIALDGFNYRTQIDGISNRLNVSSSSLASAIGNWDDITNIPSGAINYTSWTHVATGIVNLAGNDLTNAEVIEVTSIIIGDELYDQNANSFMDPQSRSLNATNAVTMLTFSDSTQLVLNANTVVFGGEHRTNWPPSAQTTTLSYNVITDIPATLTNNDQWAQVATNHVNIAGWNITGTYDASFSNDVTIGGDVLDSLGRTVLDTSARTYQSTGGVTHITMLENTQMVFGSKRIIFGGESRTNWPVSFEQNFEGFTNMPTIVTNDNQWNHTVTSAIDIAGFSMTNFGYISTISVSRIYDDLGAIAIDTENSVIYSANGTAHITYQNDNQMTFGAGVTWGVPDDGSGAETRTNFSKDFRDGGEMYGWYSNNVGIAGNGSGITNLNPNIAFSNEYLNINGPAQFVESTVTFTGGVSSTMTVESDKFGIDLTALSYPFITFNQTGGVDDVYLILYGDGLFEMAVTNLAVRGTNATFDGRVVASIFEGDGSAITNISVASIASGTVASAIDITSTTNRGLTSGGNMVVTNGDWYVYGQHKTMAMGEIHISFTNSGPTTVTQDIFSIVQGTGAVGNVSMWTTFTSTNAIMFTNTWPLMCHMGATISAESDTANDQVSFMAFRNGNQIDESRVFMKFPPVQGTPGKISTAVHWMSPNVATNDKFDIRVTSTNGTSTITVESMNLFGMCM